MQKAKSNKPKLGRSAQAVFDNAVTAVYDGIVNVSRLRQRDSKPQSMSKADFERVYVQRAFSLVSKIISGDIQAMTDVLNGQAQQAAEVLLAAANKQVINQQGDENKKEDN